MPNHQSTAHPFRLHNLWWLLLAVVSIVLDQYTKHLASTQLTFAEPVPVLPFLNWTLLHNYGAAFSFLSDAGGWQRYFFTGLAALVSIAFTIWLMRMPTRLKVLPLAIALILGGALGNLIDRVTLGYVVDFIHVYYQNHHFPAFNIADSSITLGTILLIIDTFFLEKYRIQQATAQAASHNAETPKVQE
ncbi:signal peptidase II [Alkanindiges illinoisensis]|uniref:Lipoprotein signal peptidase n=1 Tax=Alkanindiges illinoisensis TaxID=197183 RepID=A0A4Y7XC58_9GAMM|nr:signal peptidase II [Alkanindiges illinoisensis]TEU26926.1 lipoprotein signal peptidase [Alkanindiges illinoisensis]